MKMISKELQAVIAEATAYCEIKLGKGNLGYALTYLRAIDDVERFGGERALRTQLLYVLSNLTYWRGDRARAVKAVFAKYAKEPALTHARIPDWPDYE